MGGQSKAWPERMAGHRVVVVGEPVLDVYLNGVTERVSREAPVLIVQEESRHERLGGAANTAANLTALGADVTLVGFVGEDAEGIALADLVRTSGIRDALVCRQGGRTVTKTRVMAGSQHIRKQQMLRIDRANRAPPTTSCIDRWRDRARAALAFADALVVSDYGDPNLTELYVNLAARGRKEGKAVIVDSRHALLRFEGVTAVTPNVPEVEALLGVRLHDDERTLAAARELRHRLSTRAVVITRGQEGMAVVSEDDSDTLLPPIGGDAVDVTGAGDTVTAAFTLAWLAGASAPTAAALANHAASITVQQVGTATCTPVQLQASWLA
ncbi:MAG: PfkB family carbohydrate kinase [Myxococcota bacterium]